MLDGAVYDKSVLMSQRCGRGRIEACHNLHDIFVRTREGAKRIEIWLGLDHYAAEELPLRVSFPLLLFSFSCFWVLF